MPMDHAPPRSTLRRVTPSCRLRRSLVIALLVLLSAVASSQAQLGNPNTRQRDNNQSGNQQPPSQSSPKPTIVIVPELWPRLDVGALLCTSRDDLVKYQMKIAGDPVPAGPAPDCRTIRKQTAIKILDRDGPSRTQIVTTDAAKQTGWTNTYLPETPPASVAGAATK
jgi:hypothetical protein